MEPPQQWHSVWQQRKVCTPRASLLFSPHLFIKPFIYTIFLCSLLSAGIYLKSVSLRYVQTMPKEICETKWFVCGGRGGRRRTSQSTSPWFPKQHIFTVPTLRQDDLLVRSTCWWRWVRNVFAMLLAGTNRSTRRKSCSIAILSTTNLIEGGMGTNPSFRCEYKNIQSKYNWLFLTKITYMLRLKQSHLQAD